jgi:hypothetical protein
MKIKTFDALVLKKLQLEIETALAALGMSRPMLQMGERC